MINIPLFKIKEIYTAARKGKAWANKILSKKVDYFAQAIVFINQLLDPNDIILEVE